MAEFIDSCGDDAMDAALRGEYESALRDADARARFENAVRRLLLDLVNPGSFFAWRRYHTRLLTRASAQFRCWTFRIHAYQQPRRWHRGQSMRRPW